MSIPVSVFVTCRALRRSVMYAAFSPDGRWLASGSRNNKHRLPRDVSTGEMVRKLSGHKKSVYAVAFSPAGWLLASASADKSIKLWDFATGREVRTLIGHGDSVTSLSSARTGGGWPRVVGTGRLRSGTSKQGANCRRLKDMIAPSIQLRSTPADSGWSIGE